VLEIERKFLVKKMPADLDQYPCAEIAQGYLAKDPFGTHVRLRKAGNQHFLTVKHRCEAGRIEHELPISRECVRFVVGDDDVEVHRARLTVSQAKIPRGMRRFRLRL
jgi:CYTH domain-containing protein